MCGNLLALFGNNLEREVRFYGLVELHGSLVSTESLDLLREDGDVFLIHGDTLRLEGCCELVRGNGTIKAAFLGNFCGDNRLLGCDKGGLSLCVGKKFSLFVGSLAGVLLKLLLYRCGSNLCQTLRDKIIDSVTCLYGDDGPGLAEILNIFNKKDIHRADYLRRSVT